MNKLKQFIDKYFDMMVKVIFLLILLSCAIMLLSLSIEYFKTV